MSDFYIKPIIDNDGYIDGWILYESGKLRFPIAIIAVGNMDEITSEVEIKKAEQGAIVAERRKAKKK